MSKCAIRGALSGLFGLALLASGPADAQGVRDAVDLSGARSCQRTIQQMERDLRIPAGLLQAIGLVESGRGVGPGGSRVPWPWTINAAGEGRYFDTKEEAIRETTKLLDDGLRSIDVGCMQINLRYHPDAFRSLEQAFDPEANVAYAAGFLRSLHRLQGSWPAAVERYHSSDDGRRAEYRERILTAWRDDARRMIMNAVMAENTDTPYHRAVKDFAAGRYQDALAKYNGILKDSPNDRIALLGVALTNERLGRDDLALDAYQRFAILEPDNASVLTRVVDGVLALPLPEAESRLEALVQQGVDQPEVYASLSQLSADRGDTQSALSYIAAAIDRAPDIAVYHLNAGVLSDRMAQTRSAVDHYEQFIRLFERDPLVLDMSVDGVRERVRYLRTRL